MVERDEQGQIIETASPEAVLEWIGESAAPVVSSGDVADSFGIARETARNKLSVLEDRGDIARQRVGQTDAFYPADTTARLRQVVRSHNEHYESDWPTDEKSLRGVVPQVLKEAREDDQ